MNINDLSGEIIDSAIKVHSILGPGLLESAYEACLAHELELRGFQVKQQVKQPLIYEGISLDIGYRLDLLIEGKVIIELKVQDKILPIHEAQLLSYLKLSNIKLGLILNFKVLRLRDGIKRIANNI
ncbi:MAG TPA: GxxExxY protein [Gammaproteobacteria bacterium]|nr:GxxExxY protein [Gammaproteobacteria bacterium]